MNIRQLLESRVRQHPERAFLLFEAQVTSRRTETPDIVQHAATTAIVVDAATGPVVADIAVQLSGVCQRISLATTPAAGEIAWSDVLAGPSTAAPLGNVDANHVASLMYPSGTTGQPKGVMQPHRSYVIAGASFAMRAGRRAADRVLTVLPLCHAKAQFYSTMGTLVSGAPLLLRRRFRASQCWEHVQHYDATQGNFIGAMARMLSHQPPTPLEAAHRVRLACGAPVPVEITAEFARRFPLTVLATYGLSECPMGPATLAPLRKRGSMGQPARHPDPALYTRGRRVDEVERAVPVGQVGEVLLQSPALRVGYDRDPERTAEAMRGGWFHLGASARQDADGFCFFVDRQNDSIRRRGAHIASEEIERVRNDHRAVVESAVIPVPAALSEADMHAYVVLWPGAQTTEEELPAWSAARLARFKMPQRVRFRDALPKTPTQRVEKYKLREEYARGV